MKHVLHISGLVTGVVALIGAAGAARAASEDGAAGVQNHTIAYVMTGENRAIYETQDGKTECPQGYNDGPSEQFKILYPDKNTWTMIGTRLAREAATWNPGLKPETLPYHEIQGNIGLGLNLDGKIGPNDFTSPDGEKGIDNQLYRAIGCTRNFRADGETSILTPQWRTRSRYNIFVIELTGVDNLTNSDNVTVTTYRGQDLLLSTADGSNYLPGGTQTLDLRWGKKYIQKFKGKIVNGVLTTEAKDLTMPDASVYDPRDGASDILFHAMRFKLKLTPSSAEGLMGGYADIDDWYYNSNFTRDAHHQQYGGTSGPSLYQSLARLADGYPDPRTGKNTAISSGLNVRFTQVYVIHPDASVAEAPAKKTELRAAQAKGGATAAEEHE
jgi:hypothetical protein